MQIRVALEKVIDAKTAQNAVSREIGPSELASVTELVYYIVFGHGTSAGAVTIETSPITGYTGTWAIEGAAVAWAAQDTVRTVRVTGMSFISRARISTTVADGTVDVYVYAQG